MIVIDTSALLYLFDPSVPAEPDPATGKATTDVQARIQHFVTDLDKKGEKIIVPTPALSEFLILGGPDGPAVHLKLSKNSVFQIEPFDERAAIELAIISNRAKGAGDKKAGSTETIAKIKFDRQIVAIAKVNHATLIFSGDKNLRNFAVANGLRVVGIWELPLPPKAAQYDIFEPKKDDKP